MQFNDLSGKWLAEIERSICHISTEFAVLNNEQLDYRVHIHRCSIRQILHHLALTNERFIAGLEGSLPQALASGPKSEFKPDYLGKYLIRHAVFSHCKPKRNGLMKSLPGSPENSVFLLLGKQQNRLKELIALYKEADINKKLVPYSLFGLFRLSIAEAMECLLISQKSHFRLARRILMLQ